MRFISLAASLLWSVQAYAMPRVGDGSTPRGKNDVSSQPVWLVTGDPAQIDAVVAGGPAGTAILEIVPVLPPTGGDCTKPDADGNPNVICATGSNAGGACTSAAQCPPSPAYPPGTTIVGNELRAYVGGFRAWFEVQLSNWDPDGDNVPALKVYQVKLDCSGYTSGKGDPLALAFVPCTLDPAGDIVCQKAFGQNWAKCADYAGVPYCQQGYLDKSGTKRPGDNWCAPDGCDAGEVASEDPCDQDNFFAVYSGARREDGHVVYYGGTLVLNIPPGAKGKYCVELRHDETFLADTSAPPNDIPTAQENGFCVNIVTGQCCFGLGTSDEGCVDGVLRSECDDEPGPVVFTPDDRCPPDGPDCSRIPRVCCDTFAGTCQDSVLQDDCRGTHQVWSVGTACVDTSCVSHFGACCDTLVGLCQDELLDVACQGPHRVWTPHASCEKIECVAGVGACCDHAPFGSCTADVALSDCACASCTWHNLQTCAEIECAQGSIPTISGWGLGIMTLLLLTAAKIYFGRSKVAGG